MNILKNLLAISVSKASLSPLYLSLDKDLYGINGKYFHKLNKKKSSNESYDKDLAKKVWIKSLEYIE